jgi:acetolactate synthase-1/3 small subunit
VWPSCSPDAAYNIFSLAVAPAEEDGMSRITIVVDVESTPLEQITKQLFKLSTCDQDLRARPPRACRARADLLTVRAQPETPGPDHGSLVSVFEAKVLAVGARRA